MWFYVQTMLIRHQEVYAAAHERPRGNLSDLYPRWLGARELLLHHRDPYSPEVTREIQSGYYGRPLDPNRADDPKDQQGFAYPVYVVFLLAPTIGLPFPVVQSGLRWLLLILTLASVPLWLRVLRWRPQIAVTAILMILTIGSFPVVQGLKLQQLSLLVGGLIAAGAAALVAGYFSLAGFLLAVATIKPQLVLPMAAWLVLWAISDWRQRWRFVLSLGATTAVLFAVAAVGWRFRRVAQDSAAFGTILALVLAVTLMIVPTFAPYNQVLLLPAVFLVATSWKGLWSRNRPTRAACVVGALVVFWPWLAACGMTLAGLLLPAGSVERAWAVPLYTSLAMPLVVLGLLSLCAIDQLQASPSAR